MRRLPRGAACLHTLLTPLRHAGRNLLLRGSVFPETAFRRSPCSSTTLEVAPDRPSLQTSLCRPSRNRRFLREQEPCFQPRTTAGGREQKELQSQQPKEE